MSMIYKEGTASLTKGSPVLKGKNTFFLNPIFNVGVGQIVQVKTGGNVYVNSIKEVVDNETLILSFDSISDVKDGEIVIMITMVDSISDTANKLLGMTRGLVQIETEMTRWFTSMDKKITMTFPDGSQKEVYTLQAIMEQVAQNEKEMQELLKNSEKKVNDMVDQAEKDVNNVVTDGTNKINQAVDKADKEINEAITSGTGKIDTMLTESQEKIDKTIEDTEIKVDTELGKIDEKIGNRIDGKVDKTGDRMSGSLGIDSKEFSQSIEINADAEQDRTSIGNKFKDGSLAVLSFYKDNIRYAGKNILREGDYGVGGLNRLGTTNLNDVKIPGDYQQDRSAEATLGRNYPVTTAGYLNVKQTVGSWGNGCIQQYHVYAGVAYFQRSWNGSQWSSWQRFLLHGDYGLGFSAESSVSPPQSTFKDANEINFSGFATGTGNSINFFEPYAPLISSARFGGADGTGQVFQLQGTTSVNNPEMGFRVRNSGSWSDWKKVMLLNSNMNQYGTGEIMFDKAIGVGDGQGVSNNAAWLSVQRGEPDLYIKRKGKPNAILTFPEYTGQLVGSFNGVNSYSWRIAETSLQNGWAKVASINSTANKRGVILLTSTNHSYSAGSEYNKYSAFGHLVLTMGNGQQGDNLLARLIVSDNQDLAYGSPEVRVKAMGDRYKWDVFIKVSNYSKIIANYTGDFDEFTPITNHIIKELEVNNTTVFEKPKLITLTDCQVPSVTDSQLQSVNGPLGTGFFRQGGGSGSSWMGGWGSGFNIKYDHNNAFKLFIHGTTGSIRVAKHNDNGAGLIVNGLWGNSNTTVDSNGFIKTASPILEIFSDGSFLSNIESDGAIVNKLGTGLYYISNILGLNYDKAWGGNNGGFEIPLDNNKLPMIWVDYEVEPDGSVILKTYHREHKDVPPFARNLKRGYKDGDPCDIPKGRFVSVRVNMPEDSIYNKKVKEESDLMREMESNPFYKEERAFPNVIFNKEGDL